MALVQSSRNLVPLCVLLYVCPLLCSAWTPRDRGGRTVQVDALARVSSAMKEVDRHQHSELAAQLEALARDHAAWAAELQSTLSPSKAVLLQGANGSTPETQVSETENVTAGNDGEDGSDGVAEDGKDEVAKWMEHSNEVAAEAAREAQRTPEVKHLESGMTYSGSNGEADVPVGYVPAGRGGAGPSDIDPRIRAEAKAVKELLDAHSRSEPAGYVKPLPGSEPSEVPGLSSYIPGAASAAAPGMAPASAPAAAVPAPETSAPAAGVSSPGVAVAGSPQVSGVVQNSAVASTAVAPAPAPPAPPVSAGGEVEGASSESATSTTLDEKEKMPRKVIVIACAVVLGVIGFSMGFGISGKKKTNEGEATANSDPDAGQAGTGEGYDANYEAYANEAYDGQAAYPATEAPGAT